MIDRARDSRNGEIVALKKVRMELEKQTGGMPIRNKSHCFLIKPLLVLC